MVQVPRCDVSRSADCNCVYSVYVHASIILSGEQNFALIMTTPGECFRSALIVIILL